MDSNSAYYHDHYLPLSTSDLSFLHFGNNFRTKRISGQSSLVASSSQKESDTSHQSSAVRTVTDVLTAGVWLHKLGNAYGSERSKWVCTILTLMELSNVQSLESGTAVSC